MEYKGPCASPTHEMSPDMKGDDSKKMFGQKKT